MCVSLWRKTNCFIIIAKLTVENKPREIQVSLFEVIDFCEIEVINLKEIIESQTREKGSFEGVIFF